MPPKRGDYLLEKRSNGDCFGYGNESVGSVFAGGAAAVVFPAGAPYVVGQAAESKGCYGHSTLGPQADAAMMFGL
jgi:hypothetical protein